VDDIYNKMLATTCPRVCPRCSRLLYLTSWCYTCTTEITGSTQGPIPYGHEDRSKPAGKQTTSLSSKFRCVLVRRILDTQKE
jgi:hypothetical protein